MKTIPREPAFMTPFSQRPRTGWMVTFADMMALLLTFFIIMLSYSTVDSGKYDDVMSSLEEAFGTRQEMPDKQPDNAGLISREHTTEKIVAAHEMPDVVDSMQASMAEEIKQGTLEIERLPGKVLIRFPDHAAFSLGSADVNQVFLPVMARLAASISDTAGEIVVSGHTDATPIHNGKYRSNWDLSAARAVSVIHALLLDESIDPRRIIALGHADTRPYKFGGQLADHKLNRRVEIVVELEKIN